MESTPRPALALLLLAPLAAPALQETPKSELRVLFVGHDPEAPRPVFADGLEGRALELYRERTPAFDAFLRAHFEHVTVVMADDYVPSMSDEVDVTLFDACPRELTPTVYEEDETTGETTYRQATFLPAEFSRPALMISESSARIGEGIGLKLDWL